MSGRSRQEMTYLEHLNELRKRVLWCFFYFMAAVVIGFVAAFPLLDWLKSQPAAQGVEWHAFAPADAISVYLKIAFLFALIFSLPFFLYQIWAFVSPGLRETERKIALRLIPAAALLFVIGVLFAFYVLFPMILQFMLTLTEDLGAEMIFGVQQYFDFLFQILIPIALIFELPILVMFLTRLRILNPLRLKKARKIAYFLLIVTATMLTPPDVISDILVTIPLLLLYEISVWISAVVYRKQIKEDAEG